jgi:hypothetical protein
MFFSVDVHKYITSQSDTFFLFHGKCGKSCIHDVSPLEKIIVIYL